jgi:glycerol-3-phosphate dehydrogenase
MVTGVIIQDMAPGGFQRTAEVHSTAVINATGAWADEVRRKAFRSSGKAHGRKPKIRRLRGSHLVFPAEKIPLTRAVSIWHPRDKRPVFTFPWEGVTLVGTTDVDYDSKMETNPCISQVEVDYLLEVVRFSFPSLNLGKEDIQSTFSGIRSVIDTGKEDPSKESREHVLWYENGLLTIMGGKLTTFRLMAQQALNLLRKKIPEIRTIDNGNPIFVSPDLKLFSDAPIETREAIRLIGRYGMDAELLVETAKPSELFLVESTGNLWAEIRWAARNEGIIHLEDLLLRRVRLGNLLPSGGLSAINRIRKIVQEELHWTDKRWNEEIGRYKLLLEKSFSINS